MLKSIFVTVHLIAIVAITGYAWRQLAQGAAPLAWVGVLMTTAPFLVVLGWIMITRGVARTSPRLPLIGLAGVIGVALAAWAWQRGDATSLAPGLAGLGLLGFVLYSYWYSSLGARHGKFAIGQPLPRITLRSASGETADSSQWLGRPTILMFFRGNWCPLCMAQIKEIAARYRELEALGVRTALVSPQPHANTEALARTHNVNFEFYTDTGNLAARTLGIEHPGGLPLGMQTLGYDSDTVLPTVIILDARGVVIWAHETDNYRVRPEPETYLDVLRGALPASSPV
jgi:peroxiredoxin